jgi:hypothetical protein
MLTLFLVCVAIAIIFSYPMFYGAPFLPTRPSRIKAAVDLLDLQPGQTMLELGSGDGRILREAARRGIYAIGYELNPILIWYCWLVGWRYRKFITLRRRNYWKEPLATCDGIYTFLLVPYMARLDAKIGREKQGPLKLVSFAFPIPDKKPSKEHVGLLLYRY